MDGTSEALYLLIFGLKNISTDHWTQISHIDTPDSYNMCMIKNYGTPFKISIQNSL